MNWALGSLRAAAVGAGLVLTGANFASMAQAAPISAASNLDLDGNVTALGGPTANLATGLDFSNPADAAGEGDLAGFTGDGNTTLQDIAAGTLIGDGFVLIPLNIANFFVVDGAVNDLFFDLGTITVIERSAVTQTLTFQGNGTFRLAGFDDTKAVFTLTTQGTGFTSFSASTVSTGEIEVPEPVSLALFGMGLLGLGAVARARRQG